MTPQTSDSYSLLAAKGSAHPAVLPDWDDAPSAVPAADRPADFAPSVSPHPVADADAAARSVTSADLSSAQAAPLLPSHIFRSKRAESPTDKARAEPPGSSEPIDEGVEAPTEADAPGSLDATPSDDGLARAGIEPVELSEDAQPGAPEAADSDADQAQARPLAPVEAIEQEPGEGTPPPQPADPLESTAGPAADSPTPPVPEADAGAAAADPAELPGRDSAPPAAPLPDPDPGLAKMPFPGETRSKETGNLKTPLGSAGSSSLAGVVPGAVPAGRPVKRELGAGGASTFTEPGKGAGKRDLWVMVVLVLLGLAAVLLIAWSVHGNLFADEAFQTRSEGSPGPATPSADPAAAAPPKSSSVAELTVGSGDYLPSEGPSLGGKPETAARAEQALAKAETKAAVQPRVDLVRIEPTGEAIIAGVAAPHSELIVLDKGQPIGTVTVDPRGEWVLLPEAPLAKGDHEISLVMKIVSDSVKLPRLD